MHESPGGHAGNRIEYATQPSSSTKESLDDNFPANQNNHGQLNVAKSCGEGCCSQFILVVGAGGMGKKRTMRTNPFPRSIFSTRSDYNVRVFSLFSETPTFQPPALPPAEQFGYSYSPAPRCRLDAFVYSCMPRKLLIAVFIKVLALHLGGRVFSSEDSCLEVRMPWAVNPKRGRMLYVYIGLILGLN